MEAAHITHDEVRIEGAVTTSPASHMTGNNLLVAWDYYRPGTAGRYATRVTVNLTDEIGRGIVAVMQATSDGELRPVEWKELDAGADLNKVLEIAKQYIERLNAHPCRADEINEAWAYLYDRGYKAVFDPSIEGNRHEKDSGDHFSFFVRGVLPAEDSDFRPDLISLAAECEAGIYDHRHDVWTSVRCRNVEEAVFILDNGMLPAPHGETEQHDIESILPSGPKH